MDSLNISPKSESLNFTVLASTNPIIFVFKFIFSVSKMATQKAKSTSTIQTNITT